LGAEEMTVNIAKYNIKAICKILGVQPGTLRAWERRYNIVEPIRNHSGHRLYTDEHVAVLRWLLEKVNKGFTIGQAVSLLDKGSINLDLQMEPFHANKLEEFAHQLKESILTFQELKANQVLDEAFSLFTIEKVVITIIGPVLVDIGYMWEKDEITVAHEHYATQYLRTRIGMIINGLQINPLSPKVIAVCGPNERHELGLLIFTMYLRRRGYEVIYLGTGIPTKDLKAVVKEVGPKYLFISCAMTQNVNETIAVVLEMQETNEDLTIGLGGNAFKSLSKKKLAQVGKNLVGLSKEDWDEWLKYSN
jgi:DNA-binding transcriptional MerR regulator/methylmalonyl-CoA mutase cobalamin-binding subunit